MSNVTKINIAGSSPELWILPGLWKRHRIAVITFAVLLALAIAAFAEWMTVKPATVQFFHNHKLITDLVVDSPDDESVRFDSDTGTLEVLHFQKGQQRSVFVSSSVLNRAMNVTAGEHKIIRRYVSPKTGRTATISQIFTKILRIFETMETIRSVSFRDSESGKGVARKVPTSVLISQIKKEALAADQKQPSEDETEPSESPK